MAISTHPLDRLQLTQDGLRGMTADISDVNVSETTGLALAAHQAGCCVEQCCVVSFLSWLKVGMQARSPRALSAAPLTARMPFDFTVRCSLIPPWT